MKTERPVCRTIYVDDQDDMDYLINYLDLLLLLKKYKSELDTTRFVVVIEEEHIQTFAEEKE